LFLPFQVLSFNEADCLDFIANNEWPQFTPTSVYRIIRFWGNAGDLSPAATKARNNSGV